MYLIGRRRRVSELWERCRRYSTLWILCKKKERTTDSCNDKPEAQKQKNTYRMIPFIGNSRQAKLSYGRKRTIAISEDKTVGIFWYRAWGKFLGVMFIFCIFTGVWVMQMYSFVQSQCRVPKSCAICQNSEHSLKICTFYSMCILQKKKKTKYMVNFS